MHSSLAVTAEGLPLGLEIRYRKIRVLPPIGKQKRYPVLNLTVIHAEERGIPKNRTKVDWKLVTDLPVQSRKDAIEKLEWYALRWKIEVFHKILKSGCKAEESKHRTTQRLAKSDLSLLHPELAGVLDDDAQSFSGMFRSDGRQAGASSRYTGLLVLMPLAKRVCRGVRHRAGKRGTSFRGAFLSGRRRHAARFHSVQPRRSKVSGAS